MATRCHASASSTDLSGDMGGRRGVRTVRCTTAHRNAFPRLEGVPALVEYLRAHPERLDSEAHVLTFAALSSAYPCEPVLQSR